MKVTKRNGLKEDYSLDKIHKILTWAVDKLTDVNISDIEMNANLSLRDGIPTKEIHNILIKSSSDLISEECPNYQYVAARLLSYSLRKDVWGSNEPPRLYDHIKSCVSSEVYDKYIMEEYTESEIHKIGKLIKHDRDNLFTYAGLRQLMDKYLIRNKQTDKVYETPQFAYLVIAMTCFSKYDKSVRLEYIKKAYNYFSTFKISLPTPIMAGVRTNIRQYASCILIDYDDSLDSIFASNHAVGRYIAKRAGIGIGVGRIRPMGSSIRGGEVVHTGIIPYLKTIQSTVKCCSQGGIRNGSASVYIPFWHLEIEDVVVLKNNAGTDDNRVRQMDYGIQLSKLFYERLVKDEDITLFSPAECPDLFDSFGYNDQFDALYTEKENSRKVKMKKKIKARTLAELLARERLETGRIYIMNIDNANAQSTFKDKVCISNLCAEVLHPLKPLSHIDDNEGEIGVCVLAAVNMVNTSIEELPSVSDIIVRTLDFVIDHQSYPVSAAEKFCKNKRSIGVGLTNLAGYLASHKVGYESNDALNIINEYCEHLEYSLLFSSSVLAEEVGKCADFDKTKYDEGLFSCDMSNNNADKLTVNSNKCDWPALRERVTKYGLRHSTVTAQMPCESSSTIQNATNGIEPIRELITYKKSKSGVLKQVVPEVKKYGKYYTKAFDIKSNNTTTNIAAVIQKWFDMGVSTNHYYNYENYESSNVPLSVIIKDILYAYKMGLKTLYYANTPDGDKESSCVSGACAI